MNKTTELIKAMPDMLSGSELIEALTVLPDYDFDISTQNQAVRLMELSKLYDLYIPSQMSIEIYSKLYLSLLRSLQKKYSRLAIRQQNENHKALRGLEYTGIMGGSDSFTIIGSSGIGKSSAIARALELIAGNQILEVSDPFCKVIPCVVIQCPFDSSVKGLLLEVLRRVDEQLDTKYYTNALKARASTDMLIGSVSQVALNHIGLLIVDEIQNVVNSKNGSRLIGSLTQLINNSGISIAMVGTPESTVFFEQAMQLARRSLGLQYGALPYGSDFIEVCKVLFVYQYTKTRTDITDALIEWLYEHSGGNISIMVSLVHDAQEIAIMTGIEALNICTLKEAYDKRMVLLHSYMCPSIEKRKQSGVTMKSELKLNEVSDIQLPEYNLITIISEAKAKSNDIVDALKAFITVEEVRL